MRKVSRPPSTSVTTWCATSWLSKIGEALAQYKRGEASRDDHWRGCLVSTVRSVVMGCGSYLPQRVLTNDELARMVDTSDEWIVQRTGIRERHIAAPGEFTSDIGLHAARAALADAGLDAADIDLIVLATSTPDNTFPATAVSIQAGLGIHARRRLRPAGGMLRLRLWDGDRGRPVEVRQASSGRWSSGRRRSRASSTGPIAAPACCSATGRAQWCWRRRRPNRRTAAAS